MKATPIQCRTLLVLGLALLAACASTAFEEEAEKAPEGHRGDALAPDALVQPPQSALRALGIILAALKDAGLDDGKVAVLDLEAKNERTKDDAPEWVRVSLDLEFRAQTSLAATLLHERFERSILELGNVLDCGFRKSSELESIGRVRVDGFWVTIALPEVPGPSAGTVRNEGSSMGYAARRAAVDRQVQIGSINISTLPARPVAPGCVEWRALISPVQVRSFELARIRSFLELLERDGTGTRVTGIDMRPVRAEQDAPGFQEQWMWGVEIARRELVPAAGPTDAVSAEDRP